jgi:transglutaminase-like putative cysteine protease
MDTAKRRAGVCRDFAHLGIALCRALRIPPRMVVGYLYQLEPMDLHAWFEAFVGGRWYTFDPTQKRPRGNRIIIGYGRDAADVAQLSEYGLLKTTSMSVWVKASNSAASLSANMSSLQKRRLSHDRLKRLPRYACEAWTYGGRKR